MVLADDGVLDLVLDDGEALVLALLVGLDGVEVALELGELELGVVVPLRRLLGLVVEPVDACLDVVDVGLRLCGARHEADGGSKGEGGQGSDESLPAVQHERAVSLARRTPTR